LVSLQVLCTLVFKVAAYNTTTDLVEELKIMGDIAMIARMEKVPSGGHDSWVGIWGPLYNLSEFITCQLYARACYLQLCFKFRV